MATTTSDAKSEANSDDDDDEVFSKMTREELFNVIK